MSEALITNIQRFSTHDGDGIRTVVFMKGCPLDCKWCHNPETKKAENQLYYVKQLCIGCGKCKEVCVHNAHEFLPDGTHIYHPEKCVLCIKCTSVCPSRALESAAVLMSSEQIMKVVCRDMVFYGETGGMTLSGGEPLIHAALCMELLQSAKEHGMTTAVETCGYVNEETIKNVVPSTDCFLWDIKDTDALRHKVNTGVTNDKIIENLRLADSFGAKTILRCIILKGINALPQHYQAIAEIYHSLKHCSGVELLPYHTYGGSKREQLDGFDDGNKTWIPSDEDIVEAYSFLRSCDVPLKIDDNV